MKYYLDTDIIIYAMRDSFQSIKDHFMEIPAQSILIPSVVLAEIEHGAEKCAEYKETIEAYNRFTRCFETAPFGEKAATEYGKVRAELEAKGTPIGANDLMIAATVLAEDGVLVTHNVKEFSRVPDLRIEDWTKN